mmetsp:Transcript_25248/g.57409  ORF Transcript_25248/g.57409 Transcript_25248/m.57409 type:complete len:162 (-) Transcript_25248:600-1085(-)
MSGLEELTLTRRDHILDGLQERCIGKLESLKSLHLFQRDAGEYYDLSLEGLTTVRLKGFKLPRLLPILRSGGALETLCLYSLRDVEETAVQDLVRIVCDLRRLRCLELPIGDQVLIDMISDRLGRVAIWCREELEPPNSRRVLRADLPHVWWRQSQRFEDE